MKPWFVLIVFWALSGIVTLREVYSTEDTARPEREQSSGLEEQAYLF
jgi:hypothetical protein